MRTCTCFPPNSLVHMCALLLLTPILQVLCAAFHNSLSEGNLENIKLCIANGASLEWRDDSAVGGGMTPLMIVICGSARPEQKLESVQFLIEQKIPFEAVDSYESNALHCAAALGKIRVGLQSLFFLRQLVATNNSDGQDVPTSCHAS